MKRVLCAVLSVVLLFAMVPATLGATTVSFTDLNGHWAKNYVLPLARDGIISGKAPGIFDPEAQITRAEFITLVANLTNLHEDEKSPYSDVAENAWFAKTISAAKAYGVIDENLVKDGKFKPDRPISRDEMTSVVVRLAEKIRGTLLNQKDGFTDADTFSSWTKDYIAKAAGEGIVTGNPDGSFNAKGNATRAEAAVIIKRFRDLLNKPVRELKAGEYHPVYDAPIFEIDLQQKIMDAYNAGEKSISLEKGAYRVTPKANIHLNLSGMKDFVIEGNGSTMLCQSPSGAGIQMVDCENVTIKDFNVDYEPLTMWQARVTAVKTEDLCLEIEIPLGYRIYEEDRSGFTDEINTQIYKADGTPHVGVRTDQVNNFSKIEKISGRKYRLKNARMTQLGIEPGDILAGGSRTTTRTCVSVTDSKECKFINMGAWGGAVGLGIMGGYGAHLFDNFRVEPGPRPLGAIEDRVMSSIADAAHINYMEVGPTIQNCRFAGSGDDGFNCYGAFSRIAETKNDTEFVLALSSNSNGYVLEGDELRFYTPDGSFIAASVIEKMTEKPADYKPATNLGEDMGVSTFTPDGYVTVKLATPVKGLAPAGWVTNASRNCNGFVIRNSVYENIRPRGIVVKGSDGLIEGNTIRNCSAGAILMSPEFNWMESDYVRNVTVRNNTIDTCGFGGFASIRIQGYNGWDNENIVIEGNTIRNSFQEDIMLSYATGVVVKNNTIEEPHANVKEGFASIYLDKVDGAVLSGNVWKSSRTEVRTSSETKNIQK